MHGSAEAAAEARDAVERFGARAGKDVLDVVRRGDLPAAGAGGVQRSVFAIRVLLSSREDASSDLTKGIRAGLKAAAGTWAGRFDLRPSYLPEGEDDIAFAIDALEGAVRPGVLVVATDEPVAYAAALAHGLAEGAIVVDARPPGFDPAAWRGTAAETTNTGSSPPFSVPTFSKPELGYPVRLGFDASQRRPWQGQAGFVLRPSGIERGRRLGEVLRDHPEIDVVAIALPESGGDLDFARGFAGAAQALGRRFHVLQYAPGRRDFTPEARRFTASGAKAIVLTGPAGESSEWLAALSRLRARPVVFGSSELAPEGFHLRDRARLEGAKFVGDDWEDRDSTFARRIASALVEVGDANAEEIRRGFRLGFALARAVLEGGSTPTSLARELTVRSLPGIAEFPRPEAHSLVRFDEGAGAPVPWSVELPLFEVRQGRSLPLEVRHGK